VGCADGMSAVLHGMQSPVGKPVCIGGPFAFNAVNQMMIPREHVDLQLGLSAQKFAAKRSDLIGESVRVLIDDYSGPAVEIPSKNHDGLSSAGRRCTEGVEVCRTIDKEGDPMRVFDAPTVSASLEMMCGYPILNDHDEYRAEIIQKASTLSCPGQYKGPTPFGTEPFASGPALLPCAFTTLPLCNHSMCMASSRCIFTLWQPQIGAY
jgi:hypothetical protein